VAACDSRETGDRWTMAPRPEKTFRRDRLGEGKSEHWAGGHSHVCIDSIDPDFHQNADDRYSSLPSYRANWSTEAQC
jgi:hypothetical protein